MGSVVEILQKLVNISNDRQELVTRFKSQLEHRNIEYSLEWGAEDALVSEHMVFELKWAKTLLEKAEKYETSNAKILEILKKKIEEYFLGFLSSPWQHKSTSYTANMNSLAKSSARAEITKIYLGILNDEGYKTINIGTFYL